MSNRPSWFWTSLFTSIGVNAVLFISAASWLYSNQPIYLAGYSRATNSSSIYIADALPMQPFADQKFQDTIFGASDGKGDAADASPGDEPLQARKAEQAQAFMSRDAEGPGMIGQEPSESQAIPGENGSGGEGVPAMFGAAANAPQQPSNPSQASQASQASEASQAQPTFVPVKVKPVETSDAEELKPVKPAEPVASATKKDEREDLKSLTDPWKKALTGKAETAEDQKEADPKAEDLKPKEPGKGDSLARVEAQPESNEPEKAESPKPESAKPIELASIADTHAMPEAMPALSKPQVAPAAAAKAGGGKPGPAVRAADPAPKTESESDPFSTKGDVKFKRGSTDVQLGRKHKIVRPQLGLAAQTEMMNLRSPIIIVLALTLDDKGNVISVAVVKSSGSKDVDQATKVAAYKWWIEPSKDSSGKPVKDVVPFTVGFS